MNRRLHSKIKSTSTRVAVATAAALIVTVGLTATLSAKGDRVDLDSKPAAAVEVYGPFAPRDTAAALDLNRIPEWPTAKSTNIVGDVGPDHYVQMGNGGTGSGVAVYDKATGGLIATFNLGALGSGNCSFGAGDPAVLYDTLADRWMFSESSRLSSALCVYVSQTADPAGPFFAYEFVTPSFPKRATTAVWPDAYYLSDSDGTPAAYALERDRMLAGMPATVQRFATPGRTGSSFEALVPSDLDGVTVPAGTPNYFARFIDDEAREGDGPDDPEHDFLEIFEVHVDFALPGNSTITGPTTISVTEFDSGGRLRDATMMRLQYRNFGTHESLVGSFHAELDGGKGSDDDRYGTDGGSIRWFELRRAGAGFDLFQDGTYVPGDGFRATGSIAIDASGNIALAYGTYDSGIRYTGRLSTDPLGTLFDEGKQAIGAGVEAGLGDLRSDSSAISVDPADGCTFWSTTAEENSGSWQTVLTSFRLGACGSSESGKLGSRFPISDVGFSKAFSPDFIGPGSASTLTFTIDTLVSAIGVTDLAFSDTLPAGMTIATPASAFTTCDFAILSAPDGGDTISFSDGRLGAGTSCTVTVNVVGTATAMNTSGDLTSSHGNSGAAVATLTVDTALPGFSKSFAPGSIPLGGTSTLTLTLDNSASTADLFRLSFLDILPAGMVVADPSRATTDCGTTLLPATVTAAAGTNVVNFLGVGSAPTYPVLAAGATCTVTVDVTTEVYGMFVNTSGELDSGSGTSVVSGFATAALDVPRNALVKSFVDDPVAPGGSVTLEFTITNFDRSSAASSIAFDDPIDPLGALAGLAPGETLPKAACDGTLDFAAGTLSFSGGSLPPEGFCTFSVLLDVPPGAPTGTFTNTTDAMTATVGGDGVTLNAATDELFVEARPLFTKEFIGDPVGAGDDVVIRYTIENTSTTAGATAIEFLDYLDTFLPSPISVSAPTPTPPCGTGSSFAVYTDDFPREGVKLSGGNLPASGTCTFDVTVTLPVGFPAGNYVSSTLEINAVVDGEAVAGPGASDTLEVAAAPTLTKEFTNDPVQPGGTVNLRFTLTHDEFASGDATGITFTDDLAVTLPGLTGDGVTLSNVCGPLGGGSLSWSAGNTLLTFSGATLAPGEACPFIVTLDVPLAAAAGSHNNTTSEVSATVAGVTAMENPASDELVIASVQMTKEFIDDAVLPGGTATLRFTIENTSASSATSISFQDSLDPDVLPGLTVSGAPPATPCGAGSALNVIDPSGLTVEALELTGGTLAANDSCTFDVTLFVPAATTPGTYPNSTNNFHGIIDSSLTFFDNASDVLVVASAFLSLTKEFTDDPVLPGDNANLRFTLTNHDASNAASDIAFTDDLDAALSGLAATGLSISACGGTVSGTDLISLTAGSLAAGASCTFDVTLSVPALAPLGSIATNTTSSVTGAIGGLEVTGDPATDDLTIHSVGFSKTFGGTAFAGGTANLTFTIENVDPVVALDDLTFTDDLNAVIPGLVATGLPADGVCGAGSQLSGSSLLTMTGGSLPAGGSCSFAVTLQIPTSTAFGNFLNVTSNLRRGGLPVALPASATLVVSDPPPTTARMETGVVAVGGTHVTVPLVNTYTDPVVVATAHVVNNTTPVVTRVRNVTANSFELRLQNPSGGTPAIDNVSYWVVEKGVHVFDGIRIEAQTYLSTQISRKGAWNAESRTYGQTYATPVVLGQVMTENDPRWSSFFARGDVLTNPPTATTLRTGRQIGEDTDHARANETVGYIVVEAVHTALAGVEFEAALGTDTVLGLPNGAPFGYNFNSSFASAPTNAVMSIAGMDGGDGAWAQGFGTPLATTASLFLSVDEDQVGNAERSHTTEQVAYAAFSGNLVFPPPPACTVDAECDDGNFCNGAETCDSGSCLLGSDPCPGSPCDEVGDVCLAGVAPKLESVTVTAPATVPLTNSYVSPVIACTPVYAANTVPVVIRLDNVTGTGFDVSLQNPGNLSAVVSDTVHCLVVEEGSFMIDGHWVEGAKYSSTITDKERGFLGAAQTLTHAFTNPVILGQVMSTNDSRWSVYWQQGTSQANPPTAGALRNGKMVAEDPDVVRNDEMIGFIVFEQGNGTLGGVDFEAALGADTVAGIDNGPPDNYAFNVPFTTPPQFAVATQAGMDGSDGSWAYLYGSTFSTTTAVSLAVDEDQIYNAERGHTTEQVAYVAFETPVLYPQTGCTSDPECDDGNFCNGAETCNVGTSTCQTGTAVVCDDGVGCTDDTCNEATDGCDFTANDGNCDNGQFCDGAETCDAILDCQVGTDPCGGACDEGNDTCPGAGPVAQAEWGTVTASSADWVPVGLTHTYIDPVVVTSIEYANNAIPEVTRIRNVGSTGFEVMLQNPSASALVGETVSYLVVEKGTWTIGAVKIEAQKYLSTKTAHDANWNQFDVQTYGHTYTNPAVLGQVMTFNDADFSAFWSRGGSRTAPPSATDLRTGKMVGEDPDTTRADETIGFIVVEGGHGFFGTTEYECKLGPDTVASVVQAPPYPYTFSTSFASAPAVAVVTGSAMDGFNGGWTYTYGPGAASPTTLNMAGDEDQLSDVERSRATEQAAYCVFQAAGVFP